MVTNLVQTYRVQAHQLEDHASVRFVCLVLRPERQLNFDVYHALMEVFRELILLALLFVVAGAGAFQLEIAI